MGEFRIGRKFARHTYPESPRIGNALTAFARNFATGPKVDTAIGAGIQVPWNAVDAGTPPTTADVPITCRSTGIVIVSGVVTISNPSGAPILVTATVQVDGVATTSFSATTVPAGGEATIPVLAETDPGTTPIGATHQIEISIDGNGATIVGDGSSISVQEVSVATG
jgi:hypothetical protein